jgi:hypothetical protein
MTGIEEREKEAINTIFGEDYCVLIYYGERHCQHKKHISITVHPDDVKYVKEILKYDRKR